MQTFDKNFWQLCAACVAVLSLGLFVGWQSGVAEKDNEICIEITTAE